MMGMLVAMALLLQNVPAGASREDLRAGLDTLYGGAFARAAAYFGALARRDTSDPAPLVFQAGAYIWWAAALDSSKYQLARIDSLLSLALTRAQAKPASARERVGTADFWRATALGYRARQREEHGHGFSAAKDAKAMRDIYQHLLATDSTCFDCYLGLGVYEYGLARASAVSRFFARLIGLGSGNAERGIRYMRRAAHDGDLARVESKWVLAAALMREAARDPAGRAVLEREARAYVETLAAQYPANPVFQRFLKETAGTPSAGEAVRPTARASAAPTALSPVGRRESGEFAEHVVHVTLHRVGRDVEPLRDLLVAESGGNELANLLFALRQSHGSDAGARVSRSGRGTHALAARWSGRGRQVGSTRDRADRLHDVFRRCVLHDEAVGAPLDELLHVLLGRDEIHDDRFRVGSSGSEIRKESKTVAVGQRGVEQHHLRFGIAQQRCSIARVFGARHNLDVGKCREQARESITHQTIVFDNEYANPRSRRRCGSNASLAAATVERALALRHPIVQSASALRRYTTLDTANGPRHTPPPSAAQCIERPAAMAVIVRLS
ncbi:MAG TPA: hypothetical protein VG454_04685 [Gemmatimonadales bacterium]|nr:hypothetical protein [Gemmatimonadales bacterium]